MKHSYSNKMLRNALFREIIVISSEKVGRPVLPVCAGDVVLSVGDSASTLGPYEASASGQCGPAAAAAGTAASAALDPLWVSGKPHR